MLHERCRTENRPASEYRIPGVLAGGDYQLFVCRLCKAGVGPSRTYYGRLNSNPQYRNQTAVWLYEETAGKVRFSFVLPETLKHLEKGNLDETQFNVIRDYPLKAARTKYANFTKLAIVRHPLQRLVSAYYQRVVHFNKKDPMPFHKFIHRTVLNGRTDDIHWMDYFASCAFCHLNYHFVLKLEMINEDLPEVNKFLGIDPDYRFPVDHVNPNFLASDPLSRYKYDDILRTFEKEHPYLFKRVLQKYKPDMDTFGYVWENHRSACLYREGGCC